MDGSFYYASSLGGALLIFLLLHTLKNVGPKIVYYISSRLNPLVIQRRYWSSITRAQAIFLLVYAISNGVAIAEGRNDLMLRLGTMALINMLPLFFGGRTSILADKILGISFNTYYIMHHWIGRIAAMEGVIHAVLAITSMDNKINMQVVSGILVASTIALLVLTSLPIVRMFVFEFFLKIHRLLAMIAIGSLLWHLSLIPGTPTKFLFPILALTLWTVNWQVRRCIRVEVERIIPQTYSDSATKLKVQLRDPVRFEPGQYFYLEGDPYIATWWNMIEESANSPSVIKSRSLTFINRQKRGSIMPKFLNLTSTRSKTLEGPYGQNWNLECYETVMLVAQGIGIVGVLPYVYHLTNWKCHPKHKRLLLTRKVDLYWLLEENWEEEWVKEYLQELQEKDSDMEKLLQIWCCYPQDRGSSPEPIKPSNNVKCVYPNGDRTISVPTAIEKESMRTPGRSVVVACGRASFTKFIQDDIQRISSSDCIIEFIEAEYRPRDRKAQNGNNWPDNNSRSKYLLPESDKRRDDVKLQYPERIYRGSAELV